MSGVHNEILFGDNVDFSGAIPPTPQILSDGQILIGAGVAPRIRVGLLTSTGGTIAFTVGPGTINAEVVGAGFSWNVVTSATNPNTIVIENGYIPKGAGVVNFVLPAAAAVGQSFVIAGYGNLWTVAQNAGQSITLGNNTSSVGVLGGIAATQVRDTVQLVCVTANTEFQVVSGIGNIIFT